jgi:hypothetical protein
MALWLWWALKYDAQPRAVHVMIAEVKQVIAQKK